MDVNHSIALLHNGIQNYTYTSASFVHMKSKVQGWEDSTDSWIDTVPYYMNDELKIGNYKQHGLFHYTENSFCEEALCYM